MQRSFGSKSGKRGGKQMKARRAPRIMRFEANLPETIDYKDIATLRRMLSERGKLMSRRFSGVTAQQQRHLIEAIKRARYLGLLPVGSVKRK